MAWNMTPVKANASAVKTPLNEIPEDVKAAVDEAYEYNQANPGYRLVVSFADQDEADQNRGLIRSYCEARQERLTASIWQGFSGEKDGETVFSSAKTEQNQTPALSLAFSKYEKRSRTNGQPAAETATPPAEG